ncbi:hypothetical protein R5R35_011886 [Gryllus longicercus]|uniref:DNA-directed RNA polymerase III subunit RPC6 n=1 Tax=Gryllus longicercus TaxID=2509291 RepID=A0AAN9ZGU9_9ORTH|nr:Probable DNA-directed RNA polymerase III subunit RPC6 [Gryllus bimaculatus]
MSAADKGASTSQDSSSSDFEHRIIALGQSHPNGISDKDMAKEIPELPAAQRAVIINKLLAQGYIDLFNQGGVLIYKIRSAKANVIKGGDNEERIVFSIIEEAGNKGIWMRDIRTKSNLSANQLNKVLKILENKKMIKAVKSVAASKKKVYMLFHLDPDSSITGGAWYCNEDFEAEFVDILHQQCLKYLKQKWESAKEKEPDPIAAKNFSYASAQDVWKYIDDLGISKVKLSEHDVETILNTLVYDARAERNVTIDETVLFRYVEPLLSVVGLTQFPCGICPVLFRCSISGMVRPATCTYLTSWLQEYIDSA